MYVIKFPSIMELECVLLGLTGLEILNGKCRGFLLPHSGSAWEFQLCFKSCSLV